MQFGKYVRVAYDLFVKSCFECRQTISENSEASLSLALSTLGLLIIKICFDKYSRKIIDCPATNYHETRFVSYPWAVLQS